MNRYDYLEGYQKPNLHLLVHACELPYYAGKEPLFHDAADEIMKARGANIWTIDPNWFVVGGNARMVHFYYDSNLS